MDLADRQTRDKIFKKKNFLEKIWKEEQKWKIKPSDASGQIYERLKLSLKVLMFTKWEKVMSG